MVNLTICDCFAVSAIKGTQPVYVLQQHLLIFLALLDSTANDGQLQKPIEIMRFDGDVLVVFHLSCPPSADAGKHLPNPASRTARNTWDLVKGVYDAFGPDRLMWGTDWPVSGNRLTYGQARELVRDEMDFFTAEDKDWILGKTIERLWPFAEDA